MKRSILMLMAIIVAAFFAGCEKEKILSPDQGMENQETADLKAAKVKRTFEGICTFVKPEPNTWHDVMDDWRVTGTTVWEQAAGGFYGTAKLYVEAKNPHETNRGIWEMTWTGSITPTDDGLLIVATATGVGVEGKVKGMKANWTYSMDYIGEEAPNPGNPTFFYKVKGNIEKPHGPIKH